MSKTRVVLGLGSNLGRREINLKRAVNRLTRGSRAVLRDAQLSAVYESPALILEGAPADWNLPFLNCALSGESTLEPEALLLRLKEIEQSLGRRAGERWAPRIIDIDIVWWPGRERSTEHLSIPHPGLLERAFVLEPLCDLVPDGIFDGRSFRAHADKLAETGMPGVVHAKDEEYNVRTPELMGILNVTPDSFSDGGAYIHPERALDHALELVEAGAAMVDVGAESTRPAGDRVDDEEEWARLEPVLWGLNELQGAHSFRISLDSRNPRTVTRALDVGIDIINDVTGFSDPAMMEIAQGTDLPLVFMHSLSIPVVKGEFIPQDADPVRFLLDWGLERLEAFGRNGIAPHRLVFDPGIGFGKTSQQNWQILGRAEEFHDLETPLMIGHSRKSLFEVVTDKPSGDRDPETLEVSDTLVEKGVDILRVHDIGLHDHHFRRRASLSRPGGIS